MIHSQVFQIVILFLISTSASLVGFPSIRKRAVNRFKRIRVAVEIFGSGRESQYVRFGSADRHELHLLQSDSVEFSRKYLIVGAFFDEFKIRVKLFQHFPSRF